MEYIVYILAFFVGVFVFSALHKAAEGFAKYNIENGDESSEDGDPDKTGYEFTRADRRKRHMVVRIFGGIIFTVLVAFYGINMKLVTMLLLYSTLMVISITDIDTREIPPLLNIIIFLTGIISIFSIGGITIADRLIGAVCISIPLLLISTLVSGAFGGGDIKLMFAAGFFLGWRACILAFFVGVISAGVYAVYAMLVKKLGMKDFFALGPFLCLGIAVSAFGRYGDFLVGQYVDIIKLMLVQG